MMQTLQSYVRQGKRAVGNLALDPRVHGYLRAAAYILAGFGLSAAGLKHAPLPLPMALAIAAGGWPAVLVSAGGALGYIVFWGSIGRQGIFWLSAGLGACLCFSDRHNFRDTPALLPALAGLIVSASGVAFQAWTKDSTPIDIYLIRVCIAAFSQWLFAKVLRGRNPITDWLACGLCVLALAQIAPLPYFNFGYIAAGALAVTGAFPAVALSGIALDLAGITPVSMAAVLCCSFLIRFAPVRSKYLFALFPISAFALVMVLTQRMDLFPLPGLFLGGLLGIFLPVSANVPSRRGETGVAQVRLEMVAGVLAQAQQLLLETPPAPIDEDALVTRAAQLACSGCPHRNHCKDSKNLSQLPAPLLHKPLLSPEELPIICRKSGRFLAQLHRMQEQLRNIRADRERQKEYRAATVQQYHFLAEYLQDLSDQLAQKAHSIQPLYKPVVEIFGNHPLPDNGDRCFLFAGTRCRYYVLLCDGMGTGIGAVQEGRTAGNILQKLLTAGFPAEHALQTLNSLCALRARAGAVTVELLELQLDSGKAYLYKWGAAPSYLISKLGAEKVGTAGPPPGLSVADSAASVHRLSLRRGELLILASDGVGEEGALHCCAQMSNAAAGDLARALLSNSQLGGEDDATVITVTLAPL